MHLIGAIPMDERTGLLAHLDGCGECRAIAAEMTETVALLQLVDPATVEPTASVPPDLTAAVLDGLRHSAVAHRRQRRVRASALGLVGAVAAAVLLTVVFSGSAAKAPVERTVVLHGSASVEASAQLIAQPWGTSLRLRERGLAGGTVYTVSMETAAGKWWTAGTYRAITGRTVDATMACAVSMRQITGVRVLSPSGVTVLSGGASAPPSYE